MPETLKTTVDSALGPATVFFGSLVVLTVLYLGRRWFVRPAVAAALLIVSLAFFGLSLSDPQFAALVLAPDNIAIVAMVYLLAFFTWLAAAQAVENDRRVSLGEPLLESEHQQKVFTWPDLVYSELICMVLVMVILLVWSFVVAAPLEQPANPTLTPNPSKAPWYFLGLQELLFYTDGWLAGVAVPCLMILGLMAIPYLDFNPSGSGYYTIAGRRFAYIVFQFGFLQLWILMIMVGTFFRGPNWAFFGLYEVRNPAKLPPLESVNLPNWLGICLLTVCFLVLPPLLGHTVLRDFRRRMGPVRFAVLAVLLLLMLALPLKMALQWALHVRYIVSLPEWSFYL
jgi:hypothetical protein